MTYQALALLGEDGMLDIRWSDDPTGDRPAAMTVVAFGDLLRDAAPYLPDADAATALVANMTVQGAFEPWAYTQIVATRQGEITFTASDQAAWYRARLVLLAQLMRLVRLVGLVLRKFQRCLGGRSLISMLRRSRPGRAGEAG